MKIREIKVIILRKELSTSMQISRGGFKIRRHCIIQVTTEDGVYGLGEGVGNPDAIKLLVENCIAPQILGMDCSRLTEIRDKVLYGSVYFERSGSWVCAYSAIETALWDIQGKYAKKPVYELLGGLQSSELEIYASDVYWYEDTGLVRRDIEAILEKGIRNVKAHTGVLPPAEERKRFAQIQPVFDSVDKLMIDLNCAYELKEALSSVEVFADMKPFWIEEPLRIYEERHLPEVKKASKVKIAYGENIMNTEGFLYLMQQKSFDFAMPDVARVGGIQASQEVLNLCAQHDVVASFHNFSSGVLLAATMHLMAANSKAQLLEFDSSKNSVLHEFFVEPLKMTKGKMQVQKCIGLGVELTEDVLRFKES